MDPLVLLHGFPDTPRTWELARPALERHHDVLAPALPLGEDLVPDTVRLLDEAGIERAHFAGNSLGGWLALKLATLDRALSVTAFAPGGGWRPGDGIFERALAEQADLLEFAPRLAPHADATVATSEGRRRATRLISVRYQHIPPDVLADQLRFVASCGPELLDVARRHDWSLDAAAIRCPVRIVWGTEDVLLPWPGAAARFREEWLPHADWVVLDDVGHCPQLDVPLEAAQLILGMTT
ncbi:MAG TPA: alpha/beta fold hydrolase [Solirubrobacteraceae bacterium]|jgi:pimeloyl-ACP methyl ester carboxylesterase